MTWLSRERGSMDWRFLPVAICLWAGSWCGHRLFRLITVDATASRGAFNAVAVMLVCVVAFGIGLIWLRCRLWRGALAVCLAGALIGACAAMGADMLAWSDPIAALARSQQRNATVELVITSPAIVSERRDYDCRVDATAREAVKSGRVLPSSSRIRVYASSCADLYRGARLRMDGALRVADYGAVPIWFFAEEHASVVRAPSPMTAMVNRIHQAFFSVTAQLSEQGRVLVPGLTLGVLGQDHPSERADDRINDTYAATLEQRFRRSGIMHLMAVSGGHFMLITDMVRRMMKRMVVDHRGTACAVALAAMALAAVMFPSDSVVRALVMCVIGAVGQALGRPTQSMSLLCWTVIVTLIFSPRMSESFGFALSCAAVAGIVTLARPLSRGLMQVLPSTIADIMGVTIAAQLFAMPIQVIMESELPLFSIPANLLVSPVVGFATLAGLCALGVAWVLPQLALLCARVASCGTLVMERTVMWLGESDAAVVTWSGGVQGALIMATVELICGAALVCSIRLILGRNELPGHWMGFVWRMRVGSWWRQTTQWIRLG